jgi:hypothetical protein
MKKYYFISNGQFYAYDIFAYNLKDCKERIKKFYGVNRLPYRIQIWEA